MDAYSDYFDYDLAETDTDNLRSGLEILKKLHRSYGHLSESIERLEDELARREGRPLFRPQRLSPLLWQDVGF